MKLVRLESRGPVLEIRLSRPEARNAFDEALIAELRAAFSALPGEARVAVLSGEGPVFCAGGDAGWMRRSKDFTIEENRRDAEALADLLLAVEGCPLPVVARVHGAAIGGGAGLVAACDLAVASDEAVFAFPEARLGLIPALISLVVLPRIGSAAGRWFLTGERFGAAEARAIGLVHEVVPAAELDARVASLTASLLKGAPQALGEAKRLLRRMPGMSREEARHWAVETLCRIRVGAEAQEGLAAFLEKRAPAWPG